MGTYRIVKKLAAGGMAEVFLGKVVGAEGFEKPVAVKRILPSYVQDAAFVELFLREAKVSVALQHGNVVQVMDLGTSTGQYYMVMEFVDGENLRTLLRAASQRQLPMGLREVCFIAQQVADGLAYAHGRTDRAGAPLDIIHRDINPSNVMVSSIGGVKLADFGIAKVAGAHQETQAGVLKGKINYLSPEQVQGRPVDQRSDIFLLGLLLYEMLAGRRLFDGSYPQIIHALGNFDEHTLEPLPGVPAPLWAILLRSLAAAPSARFQTAREFSESMQSFLFDHRLRVGAADIAGLFGRAFPDRRSPLADLEGMPGEEIRLEGEELPRVQGPPARDARRPPPGPPPMLRPAGMPPPPGVAAPVAVARPPASPPPPPALAMAPPARSPSSPPSPALAMAPPARGPAVPPPPPGPRARTRQQLGAILVARGMVTPQSLEEALSLQKQRGGRLGQLLVVERKLEPENLVRALSEQSGLPHITDEKLQSVPVPEELLRQVPRELCEKLCAVPVALRGRELFCAVLDPRDVQVTDALKFSARAVAVQGLFATEHAIRRAIRRFYPGGEMETRVGMESTDSTGRARMLQFEERFTGRAVLGERELSGDEEPEPRTPAPSEAASRRAPPPRSDARARMVLVVAEPSEPREAAVRLLLMEGLAAATSPAAEAERALSLGGYDLVLVLEDGLEDAAGMAQRLRAAHPRVEVRVLPSYSAALMGEGGPLARLGALQMRLLEGVMSMLGGSAVLAPFVTQLARRIAARLGAGSVEESLIGTAASALALAARLEEPCRFILPSRARALALVGSGLPEVVELLTAVLAEGSETPAPAGRAAGALLCSASFVLQAQSAQPNPADAALALQALRQDPRLPPAALEALAAELTASAVGQDKTAPRVMVAETDAANAMTLQIRLMAEGLATVRTQSRAEVEQALGAGVQAAILADPLPDGDLYTILRALRKNAATEDLPVYLILDKEDPAVVTAALEAGADDVLMRPANVEVLIAKLRRAIHQRQAARRNARAAN
ncbi:protein kinase domain-containing protein [Pyxidicoccus sp. MSG2]|uniref:protein kinase domain-containing protein n=1 Tax=Pyxidicoccus sp. MSG2 TaxID=2996790 RepID=UPI002271705D|nr:protein kinase [Pyxidicoccus sp. MSG2]MCY1021611.1 protein kinase [Pyxidicoccus sp. MSG2]